MRKLADMLLGSFFVTFGMTCLSYFGFTLIYDLWMGFVVNISEWFSNMLTSLLFGIVGITLGYSLLKRAFTEQ